ncbi:FAD-dependent monooxygenase [Pararhizobium sp. BT-229]|uniref:FAD-dependent oxidoreductase n=1 Tax=Pararhizobium sp. BT-229 TaxID=2986923 RepID=UPI0021F74FD6|nr:NAD(P)/FAD-dependent oxidoreductase [Pararhizobium sp. BT-229]MCV9960994.1 FAD-dependent monooxygenase [Pararhizobium sp. BT-229]
MDERTVKSILIVGAGPTGLALALELARRDFRPRLVAKANGPTPVNESRALGINARTLTLLEASGASALILSKARRLTKFRISSAGKLLLTVDTEHFRGRYCPMHALPQGDTERLLLKRLASFDIVPEWQTEVSTVSGDVRKPIVTLSHQDGRTETVQPDILIGADGAHSAVRKTCGFAFPGDAIENRFFLADYRYTQAVDTSFLEMNFLNPGVLGHLPVNEDTLRYISTIEDFEDRIEHPATVKERTWSSEFSISFHHVERMSRGNVFLAGDAAHVHSPAGARGMNLGIEDACWLAWLISEGREQDYSDLRMPAVQTVLKETRRNTTFITLKNPFLTGLRSLFLPQLNHVPSFTAEVLRKVSGRDTRPPPWIPGAE